MAEKEKIEVKGEALGISGFTLGIISLTSIAGFMLFGAALMGMIFAIIGFIFCLKQKKRKETKLSKKGIILNVIGFILNTGFFIYFLIYYLIPAITKLLSTVSV